MPMESSTVTNCSVRFPSGPVCISRSVRPRVGRISARAPVTACERLSLVETWTVSRARRMAASVTSVSGVAATKLPPIAKNTLACPSRSARMARTTSSPCSRGGAKPNSFSRASRKAGAGRSKMPMVRSPWTLLWPRTGQTPAPGRPMLPRSRRKLTTSWMVGTECLCWVRPIAQHTMVRRESRIMARARSISARVRPVARSVSSQSLSARACWANSSKPWVWVRMKSSSRAPSVSRRRRLRARKSAWSPPRRTWRKRSVSAVPPPARPRGVCGFLKRSRPASGSGLIEMIFVPPALAFSRAVSIRGWLVPGFCPAMMIRSAW